MKARELEFICLTALNHMWKLKVITHLKAKTVHLEEHFAGKEHNEEEVGDVLEVIQPGGLSVMFSSKDAGVQKDQNDNQPKHGLGLDSFATFPTSTTVEFGKGLLLFLPPGVGLGDGVTLGPFGLSVRGQLRCNRH